MGTPLREGGKVKKKEKRKREGEKIKSEDFLLIERKYIIDHLKQVDDIKRQRRVIC